MKNPRNTKAEEIASKSAERLLKQANQQEQDIAPGVIDLLAEGRVDDAYDLTYALLNCRSWTIDSYLERDGKEIEEQHLGQKSPK